MSAPTYSFEVAYPSAPLDTAPDWTEEISRVRELSFRYGRNFELDRAETGKGHVLFEDTDRRFDRFNAAGAYYPLKRMRPCRFRETHDAITYDRFRAFIEYFPLEWEEGGGDPQITHVRCPIVDGFKLLAGMELPSPWEIEVRKLNPTHWWRFTEKEGAAADSVGDADGAYEGTGLERATDGMSEFDEDRAFKINGSDGGVTLPASHHPTAFPVSIAGWFRYDGTDQATFGLFSRTLYHSDAATLTVYLQSGSLGTKKLQFQMTYGGEINVAESTVTVADGEKHDFVVVLRATGVMKVYVDGADVTDQTLGPDVPSALPSVVGAFGSLAHDEGAQVWFGGLDEMVIWSGREVTSAEAAALHDARVAPWQGDTAGERIERILDAVGWPAAWRDLDMGVSTLQAADEIQGSNALEAIQAAADADFGVAFIDPQGNLVFQDRHHRSANELVPVVVFGDGGGSEIEYEALAYDDSDQHVKNVIRVTRKGGATHIAEDATSITDNGTRTLPIELPVEDDEDARGASKWLLNQYKDPLPRVGTIPVKPLEEDDYWTALLPLVLSNRVGVKRRPMATGAAIDKEYFIESINETYTPEGEHTFDFEVSPAEGYEFWILGDATYGVLGSTTRLGY